MIPIFIGECGHHQTLGCMSMRVSILYDNTARDDRLTPGWGFSCLVEAYGLNILFDTGADAGILAGNMKIMGVDPRTVDCIFISHDHWDHTGGLSALVEKTDARVYVPESFAGAQASVTRIRKPLKLAEHIHSTGELNHGEQSLVVCLGDAVVVVVGCAHPGVREILAAASAFGNVSALIGGLHGCDDFDLLGDLNIICPTHCTRRIDEIAALYPGKYIPGGAGAIISF